MKNKNVVIAVLVTIIGVAIILMIIGAISEKKDAVSTSADSTIKDSFVNGCTSKGATVAECSCAYDRIDAKYGFGALAQDYAITNVIADKYIAVIQSCIN